MTPGPFSAGHVIDSLARDLHGYLLVFLNPQFFYSLLVCFRELVFE